MKISKLSLLSKPKIFAARLKGINPFYSHSPFLARKILGGKGFKTIIDIGANVGDYSRACKFFFPKAEIHAFEPNPHALKELMKKKFLKFYNVALTSKDGKIDFNFDSKWNSTSSILEYEKDNKRFGEKTQKIKVDGKRFDSVDLDMKRPCFVKIETQGTEADVLKGFGERLKEVDVLNVILNFIDNYAGQTKLSEIALLTEKAGLVNFVQTYVNEKKGCELYFFRRVR